ncbi:MAG: sigma-54 dependent transcriptional regulator [Planctomycetota bacterium]|nr:sigma-54 dependent transcriptional regulator [Planctomycetota bacterium]
MRRPVALIVGREGPTTKRLKAHLNRRGLHVPVLPDCGSAMESIGTAGLKHKANEPFPVRAVILDVDNAGFGVHAFREMLKQDYPGVGVLELPPEDAGPEDVGLVAMAVFQGMRDVPAEPIPAGEGEERFEGVFTGYKFEDLESRSAKMLELFELIPRVAQTDSAVLIRGETGTGKELVAAAIHRQSKRRDSEFFTINCGALTETLLESELFGHEKGAFTGAVKKKKGYFELASGGTLFLDELGTISNAMQVRLLRVLERMEVRRVGGARLHDVDVRIVAATNERLEEHVAAGKFREDLYYRLNVVQIEIPPLRERSEDVPLLAEVFRQKFATKVGREDVTDFEPQALAALKAYGWPGNVRELEHVVERAVIMTRNPVIKLGDLPDRIQRPQGRRRTAIPSFDLDEPLSDVVTRVRTAVEKEYLRRVLRRYRGHLGKTAAHAGVNRRTLYNKMQLFGLKREDYR